MLGSCRLARFLQMVQVRVHLQGVCEVPGVEVEVEVGRRGKQTLCLKFAYSPGPLYDGVLIGGHCMIDMMES